MSEAVVKQGRRSRRVPLSRPPLTVTIHDAEKITGIGRSSLFHLIRNGRLKTASVGRRRLIVYSSLEDLLTEDA
jgi:hypothetical protein